jgi:energy-coupling factor transporter ATP-binding protein EcfA2
MPAAEIILSPIIEAIVGYVLEQSQLGERLRRALKRDPVNQALARALDYAFEQLRYRYPEHAARLPDTGFFRDEAAPILAQFLTRDGRPNPTELAARWAAWLGADAPPAHELGLAAGDFLADLDRALRDERDLTDFYNARALEHLVKKLDAAPATPATRRAYLHWLVERNLYLDPRGTLQTQRQVQVKLEEVYISLRAQREDRPGGVDRRLLERELAELEGRLAGAGLSAEEVEDRREQLLAGYEGRRLDSGEGRPGEVLELAQAVQRHERLVILGDPGCGKTTLLRYLALKHAQSLESGRVEIEDLGRARFPILIRIADYAENGVWKKQSLSKFLAQYCARRECPPEGLDDLLRGELEQGHCLVLLDGLDEIVEADDRRGIVDQIEDFVRRYDHSSNRFVVTSRVAGYRSAPLGAPFACYLAQEMDLEQIRRFLERWCTAVEAAQTPELSAERRQAVARREIESIMAAVENSPGVRRLAANPLMLRTLALIHRSGAQLPQKRVELYKLAADTLARTWRTAQGVPESALVDERYLTRLLGKMAYWLHAHKPTGIATQREVYRVLGQEWAQVRRIQWDEQNLEIQGQVEAFLRAVREHTGLFVERAPRRYGFMHLTFEEYYAARHLVARRRQAPGLMRERLHDPRWQEPILLALGFVGLDYPQEAAELLETAVLAQGEEAEELDLSPSPHEELLGRDYLFALRCLGDQIPADPHLIRALSQRLAGEFLRHSGSARFQRYRTALGERLAYLKGSEAADELLPFLVAALGDDDGNVRDSAAWSLGQLGQASPPVVEALVAALGADEVAVRSSAAWSLVQLGQASPPVVEALAEALQKADDWSVRRDAARMLGQLGAAGESLILALWRGLLDTDNDVRAACAGALARLGRRFPGAAEAIAARLVGAIRDPGFDKPDEIAGRSGHDYAFEGLWLLVSGGEEEGDEGR